MEVGFLPRAFSFTAGLFEFGDVCIYPRFFLLIWYALCAEWRKLVKDSFNFGAEGCYQALSV